MRETERGNVSNDVEGQVLPWDGGAAGAKQRLSPGQQQRDAQLRLHVR